MSDIKRLFKHGMVYAIGNAIQSAVAFILIPIYTRYLSPANYGYLEILNTFVSIVSIVLGLGFASALMKTYFRDVSNDDERRKLVGTAFMFSVPVAFLTLLAMFLFSDQIGGFILQNPEFGMLVRLSILSTFFVVFMNLGLSLLRVQEKSKKYTITTVIRFLGAMGFNIYFVVYRGFDIEGVLWANLISYTLVCLSLLPDIIKSSNFSFSKTLFKKLWLFGLPIIPASIAMWFVDISDRYMLQFFRTSEEVGIYSLGYKFGFLLSILLVAPLQLAWPTVYFSIAHKSEAQKIYSKVLTYYSVIGIFIALSLSLFAENFLSWFAGSAFIGAYKIVPLVAFAYVLYGVHFILVPGLHIKEKTKLYPWLVIIPAITNILMNLWAIPRYGMTGAATTTILSFAIMVIFTQILTRHYYEVKYESKKLFGLVTLAVLFLFLGLWFRFDLTYINIVWDVAVIFGFVSSLFFFKIIAKKDIGSLLLSLRK